MCLTLDVLKIQENLFVLNKIAHSCPSNSPDIIESKPTFLFEIKFIGIILDRNKIECTIQKHWR